MRARIILLLAILASCSRGPSLADGFMNPPDEFKPWCYWWWLNGNVDKETVTADLESMKELGFGGFLIVDSRGYWDDDEHVRIPEAAMEFMSEEWFDMVAFSIKEAQRLGLEVALNPSASGGTFKGTWSQGENSPKKLVFRFEAPQPGMYLPKEPDMPYYKDVAFFAVKFADSSPQLPEGWHDCDDMDFLKDAEMIPLKPCEDGLVWDYPNEGWSLLRFGRTVIPGYEYDVDILDPQAVENHLRRVLDPLKERVGDAFGKTFNWLYSVSWEGSMPTWADSFECNGRDFFDEFRKERSALFLRSFYGTMRDVCHAYGLKMFSESGGPWNRDSGLFKDADQIAFLAVNDMPQGEFWYREDGQNYFFTRGAAATSHAYALRRASAEAFTDMILHWSEYPSGLKPFADQAFLDGINHLVWHTFTCSPDRFGTPGAEYFAGTHINRNVTWQSEAGPFITYLARCQYMLQQGEPVTDLAVTGGDNVYQHWGHYRNQPFDSTSIQIPPGFNYDLYGSGMRIKKKYSAVLTEDSPTVPPSLQPDFEGPFFCTHRRKGHTDIYFVAGEGSADMTFRAKGDVQIWDAVSGRRSPSASVPTSDGRTVVHLELPEGGSAFVVFNSGCRADAEQPDRAVQAFSVDGPWHAEFTYHKLPSVPPAPREWDVLHDLAVDEDRDVRWFSGTVCLKTSVVLSSAEAALHELSLGEVRRGLAHVFMNGADCGICWTAPWVADVSGLLKEGENDIEIRFTNTWENRLIGDCNLPPEERVTSSNLQYHQCERGRWLPTKYSGYASGDPLVSNGVFGPVELR